MRIPSKIDFNSPLTARAPKPEAAAFDHGRLESYQGTSFFWKDLKAVSHLATHAAMNTFQRKLESLTAPWSLKMSEQPAVDLARPLLVVPGWSTQVDILQPLLSKLAEPGTNGTACYIKEGRFYKDSTCQEQTESPVDSKIFVLVYDDIRECPDRAAAQLKLAMKALTAVVGNSPVDAVGYSMGGLASRKYLSEGGRGLGKLMLLGTPNHGAALIGSSAWVLQRDMKWAIGLAGLHRGDRPALEAMSSDSPWLTALNSHLEQQKLAVEAMETVGGEELMTLTGGFQPRRNGDGLVSQDSLALPGVPGRFLSHERALLHEHMPTSAQVYQEMAHFFEWTVHA